MPARDAGANATAGPAGASARASRRWTAAARSIYARVRVNQLDPADNDITRGERQQAVVQALADEITSFRTFLRMPFIGDELVAPLATDLSANQFLQLGWVKRRTPSSGILRCRLGGTIADIDGQSFIIGSEDNASVIAMVEGKAAPQRPRPGSGHVRAGLPRRPERLSGVGRWATAR